MLSSAYPKLMIFQFPRLCWWAGAQMAGREQAKDNCPELAKGIFCTTERIVQCINWQGGGWPETVKCCSDTDWALVSGWWAAVSCITCISWILFLFPFLLYSFSLQLSVVVVAAVYFTLFQLLSYSYLNP